MGQAPSTNFDTKHAGLACFCDKDLDPPCLEVVEAALEWTKDAWLAFERDPTAMVRASAVDLLAPQRASAKDELRVLLRSPRVEEYTVGAPWCPGGFVRALPPGVVERDTLDHMPCSGYREDPCHPTWADHEAVPYVELARRHPGDEPGRAVAGTSAKHYDGRKFAPLTTRAGGRVWSAYFATPGGEDVCALHAAYPCQVLVRHDAIHSKLVYDVSEFVPALAEPFNARHAAALDGDAAAAAEVCTPSELKAIEALIRRSRDTRNSIASFEEAARAAGRDRSSLEAECDRLEPVVFDDAASHQRADFCELCTRFEEIQYLLQAMDGDKTGGDPLAQVEVRRSAEEAYYVEYCAGTRAAAPRDRPHAARLGAYRPGALRRLVNHVRWKRSSVRRVRVDLSDVVAARVDVLDARRPHGDMPPPRNRHGLSVADLGTDGEDPDAFLWGDESDRSRVRRATGLIARGAELEPIAILCLDFGGRSPAEFATTRVCPIDKQQRVRVACGDWTPGAVAGRATRHYVVGDASEIRELADALAAQDPGLRALLEAGANEDQDLGRPPARLDPARAPATREAPPPCRLPDDVVGAIAAFAAPPKPAAARTADDVHAFLRAAGVENAEDDECVNPCLKQAMLRGHVSMTGDPAAFMDVVVHEGPCLVCSAPHVCTVRDVLHQWIRGGDYGDGGPGGAVQCEECCGLYVTDLCGGRPRFDCGKGHNHCVECPGFGECIGDIRNDHCHRCSGHYFAGFMGSGQCDCRGGRDRPDPYAYGGYAYGGAFIGDESPDDDSDGEDPPLLPAAGAFDAVLPGIARQCIDSALAFALPAAGPRNIGSALAAALSAAGSPPPASSSSEEDVIDSLDGEDDD